MSSKKLFSIASLLVIAGIVISACAPAATTPGAPVVQTVVVAGTPETVVVTATPETTEKPKVLRINLSTYPDLIDPQKSSFVNEIAHLKLIYEGLTTFDETLATVPGAAESWEYNADATQVTFTLREGLQYSDGSLLNAERFEYSILRNIDPATAGEYAAITDEILGAPEWRGADTTAEGFDSEALKAAVGVKALDASGAPCADYEQADCLTLQITLSKPAPYFHTVMGLWVTYPAKEENISTGGENWWNSSVFQVGNGPYVLQSLEPFVRGYLTPNPNYWRGTGVVDIEYRYIVDSAISFEAYKNNELDIIASTAEDLAVIEADADLNAQHLVYPGSCTIAFMLHQLKEPFTDQKVREAFAYALDREAWVRDVDAGLSAPTLTWIPQGYPGYKEGETRWGFDPEKAKAALAESSYGSAEALGTLEMTFSDSPRNRVRHEWLAAQYKEVLGVDIALNPVEATTYTALTKDVETSPLFYRLGWCADYPDPQNWLSVYWKTGGFGERIGYSNPEFDALVNAADVELDPVKRADLYQQAQDLFMDDAAVVMMYNTINHYLVKPWVKGIATTPQDSAWPGDINPIGIDIDTAMIP